MWHVREAEQAELRATGVGYLTATWQLAQLLTDAARRTDQPFVRVDTDELLRLRRVMTEARTQLDLVGGERVYGISKQYNAMLLHLVERAENGSLPAGTNVILDTVEARSALMKAIRNDLGRPAVLQRGPHSSWPGLDA